jgi:hypothetical protein
MEPKKRKKRVSKNTNIPDLSSVKVEDIQNLYTFESIQEKISHAVNNEELQKSLSQWEKQFKLKQKVSKRDLGILKDTISEYLGTFLLFGYNLDDERIIIQKFENARDRDAIMEFLKNIFIKQQTENFLD